MVRVAKKTDYQRLEDLKKKINDELYLELAVKRIALTLTEEIMMNKEDPYESKAAK